MRKQFLSYFLTLAAGVAITSQASAHSDTNDSAGPDFREDLQRGVLLTATSNAPAGAKGRAQIIAVNNNGTNASVLFVKTTGLTNGSYFVKLADASGSNTYHLGALNVATATNPSGCGSGDRGRSDRGHTDGGRPVGDPNLAAWTNWIGLCAATNASWTNLVCGDASTNCFGTNVFNWYTNTLSVGSGSFVLPAGLAQSNVSGIFVCDSNNVVDLAGSFAGVTNTTSVYIETVSLVPGTATNVQGQATLTITSRNGKISGSFKLSATGLAASQKLWLTANGTNTSKAFTSASGTLKLNGLPHVNLANLKTVVATDVSSNVVFSAGF